MLKFFPKCLGSFELIQSVQIWPQQSVKNSFNNNHKFMLKCSTHRDMEANNLVPRHNHFHHETSHKGSTLTQNFYHKLLVRICQVRWTIHPVWGLSDYSYKLTQRHLLHRLKVYCKLNSHFESLNFTTHWFLVYSQFLCLPLCFYLLFRKFFRNNFNAVHNKVELDVLKFDIFTQLKIFNLPGYGRE